MGELIVNMFLTFDGVMQSPGMPDEDREGGFAHGGWQFPFLDDASGAAIMERIERMDALLLGRKTYDIFARYWPHVSADDPVGRRFNPAPKYVASRTLERLEWNNARRIEGDLRAAVMEIKAAHDEVHTWGSAELVQALVRAGLVDRFFLIVYPLVLGTGKRLFPEGVDPLRLKLVASRTFEKGAVLLTYEPDGKPEYGVMGAQGTT